LTWTEKETVLYCWLSDQYRKSSFNYIIA